MKHTCEVNPSAIRFGVHFVCAVSRHRSSDFGNGVESEQRLGIQDDVHMYTKSLFSLYLMTCASLKQHM